MAFRETAVQVSWKRQCFQEGRFFSFLFFGCYLGFLFLFVFFVFTFFKCILAKFSAKGWPVNYTNKALVPQEIYCTFKGDNKHVNKYNVTAKSLQSCPTLCDPRDGSPSGSPIPGTLQARTLEWVAISFSNAWKWKVKVKSLSRVWLLVTPWTAAYQTPPSMGFSRLE